MDIIPVRELQNNTAAVMEQVRNGDEVTITINGAPAAKLVPIDYKKRNYLTVENLKALQPKPGSFVPEYWDHEVAGDTTDDLSDAGGPKVIKV